MTGAINLEPSYRELVELIKAGPLSVQRIAQALGDTDKQALDACNLLGRNGRGYLERVSGVGRSGVWQLSAYGRSVVEAAV